MAGTNDTDREAEARKPWPFAEEMAQRQREVVAGAEPWNLPVEERRAGRRRDMELLRLAALESAFHITEYIAGRLPNWKKEALEKLDNPVAALANLSRAIIQVTLAEDRFDETREERAERVKAEAEAKARAAREAEAARTEAEATLRKAENKRQVQGTVRAVSLSGLNLSYSDREKTLADLFEELERDDTPGGAYDRDPADTAIDLCLRLGIGRKAAGTAERSSGLPWLLECRTAVAAQVRAHMKALRGPHTPDAEAEPGGDAPPAPFAPTAPAQGPPN